MLVHTSHVNAEGDCPHRQVQTLIYQNVRIDKGADLNGQLLKIYSTVTDFARFLGLSTLSPLA